jgi:hypothetical protein
MELPEVCFCGCGEPRAKLDAANIEGFVLAIELARYVSYLSVMQAAEVDLDPQNLDDFLDNGRGLWMAAYDEVHNGVKVDRKTRKLRRRWLKFSEKSRGQVNRGTALPFDPFDQLATPQQVHTWVVDNRLPAVDELPDY